MSNKDIEEAEESSWEREKKKELAWYKKAYRKLIWDYLDTDPKISDEASKKFNEKVIVNIDEWNGKFV